MYYRMAGEDGVQDQLIEYHQASVCLPGEQVHHTVSPQVPTANRVGSLIGSTSMANNLWCFGFHRLLFGLEVLHHVLGHLLTGSKSTSVVICS